MKIRDRELHPFTSRTLHYTARVPKGTTLADVMQHGYWADVATKLKVRTLIEVISEDGSLDCDLRVVGCTEVADGGPPVITVKLLRNGFVDPDVEVPAEPLTVQWSGPKTKWRVMRGNSTVAPGFDTKEAAEVRAKELEAA